jgi:hypothetical protein
MPCACQVPTPKYPETADWGPILWTILHGLAEKAGANLQPVDEIREWQKFITLTGEMLPCEQCRAHYSTFLKENPVTRLSEIPYSALRIYVKSWFWTLHNEVNTDNGKPVFDYDALTSTYGSVSFYDLYFRLEPVIKKAIQLSGVSLMKWMNWVKSFKMLRANMGI